MSSPVATISKLKRETLAEQAAVRLTEWMRAESLRPGDALPSQSDLAGQFGVSRTVIREAIQSLIGRGLVEVLNGKGAVIRAASSDALLIYFQQSLLAEQHTLVQMMEVRRGLEVQAAQLAALRRTDVQIGIMRGLISDMRACLRDPERYAGLDLRLHLTIAEEAHNTMLEQMIQSIRDVTHEAILAGLERQGREADRQRIQREHEQLVDWIAAGDTRRAQNAMEDHFDAALAHFAHAEALGRNGVGAPS